MVPADDEQPPHPEGEVIYDQCDNGEDRSQCQCFLVL